MHVLFSSYWEASAFLLLFMFPFGVHMVFERVADEVEQFMLLIQVHTYVWTY